MLADDVAKPFVCTMSEESPVNFDCSPRQGVLRPRGAPGQPRPPPPIQVHFTCREFGRTAKATMYVHTKDAQYTFAVIGRQPAYQPPSLSARVDTRLPQEVQAVWDARKAHARRAPRQSKSTW